jgi:hypothetical protein
MGLLKSLGKIGKAVVNAPKKIGKGLKKLATDPKEWAQNAGKSVGQGLGAVSSFIPGPLDDIAASVLQGGTMKDHAMAGVGGMVGGGSLGKIPGFAGGSLGDLMGNLPGAGGIGGALKKLGGSSVGDMAGSALDFVRSHPDELLAAGEGILGAHAAIKARSLRGKALGSAEGAYRERAPLRKLGVDGMASAQAPDLSSLFADASDPYKQPRLKRMGGM